MCGKPVSGRENQLMARPSLHGRSRRPRGISTKLSQADCRLSWKCSMLPDAVLPRTCGLCRLSSGQLNERNATGGTWLGETCISRMRP